MRQRRGHRHHDDARVALRQPVERSRRARPEFRRAATCPARADVERGQQQRRVRHVQQTAECRDRGKQRLGLFAAIGYQDLRPAGCPVKNGRIERPSRSASDPDRPRGACAGSLGLPDSALDQRLQPALRAKSGEQFFDTWVSQDGLSLEFRRPQHNVFVAALLRTEVKHLSLADLMERASGRHIGSANGILMQKLSPRRAFGVDVFLRGLPAARRRRRRSRENTRGQIPSTERIIAQRKKGFEYPAEELKHKKGAPAVNRSDAPRSKTIDLFLTWPSWTSVPARSGLCS